MIKYVCDRCGKEVSSGKDLTSIKFYCRDLGVAVPVDDEIKEKDFCEDCMNKIRAFILRPPDAERGGITEEAAPEPVSVSDPAPPEETELKPKPARKKIDRGKVVALHNAGWKNKDIADEMSLTPETVSQVIYQEKKKANT